MTRYNSVNNAEEYLKVKGIFGLDTKKRYHEVIEWMEEYARERVKNVIAEYDRLQSELNIKSAAEEESNRYIKELLAENAELRQKLDDAEDTIVECARIVDIKYNPKMHELLTDYIMTGK